MFSKEANGARREYREKPFHPGKISSSSLALGGWSGSINWLAGRMNTSLAITEQPKTIMRVTAPYQSRAGMLGAFSQAADTPSRTASVVSPSGQPTPRKSQPTRRPNSEAAVKPLYESSPSKLSLISSKLLRPFTKRF